MNKSKKSTLNLIVNKAKAILTCKKSNSIKGTNKRQIKLLIRTVMPKSLANILLYCVVFEAQRNRWSIKSFMFFVALVVTIALDDFR